MTEAPAGERRPTPDSRIRTIPASVWAISGLWAALLLGASLLWPAFYGYDEPAHVDMAYAYAAAPFHFYGPGQLRISAGVVGAEKLVPAYPPKPALDRLSSLARDRRPTFAQLGGQKRTAAAPVNQMVQHPPLYYEVVALVLRIPGVSSLGWDVQVWLMRFVSIIFMLPTPLLCWAATARLLTFVETRRGAAQTLARRASRYGSRIAILGALLPLTIPNMVRDGASVTNDSLLVLSTSVVLYGLTRVMTGDLSKRTAAWIAAATAAALLTKGFGLILPPVVVVAYVLSSRSTLRGAERAGAWTSLGIALCGAVVGGLWWLRNLLDYGVVQTDGLGGAVTKYALYGRPTNNGTLAAFIPRFITDVVGRIWGGIGVPDMPSPGPFVIYGWFILVSIGLVAALLGRGRGRLPAWVLVTVPVLTMLIVAQGSFSDFRHWTNYTHGTQGRYLYQTVVGVSALAVVGWHRLLQPRVWSRLLVLCLFGALVTNLASWLVILRSWYAAEPGLGGLLDGVHGMLHWSPLPEAVTVLFVAALPVAAAAAAAIALFIDARSLPPPEIGGTRQDGDGYGSESRVAVPPMRPLVETRDE